MDKVVETIGLNCHQGITAHEQTRPLVMSITNMF